LQRSLGTKAYREFREKMLARAEYKCERCGAAGKLHVHHLRNKLAYPELLLARDNVRVLCPRCHALEDKIRRESEHQLPLFYYPFLYMREGESPWHPAWSARSKRNVVV